MKKKDMGTIGLITFYSSILACLILFILMVWDRHGMTELVANNLTAFGMIPFIGLQILVWIISSKFDEPYRITLYDLYSIMMGLSGLMFYSFCLGVIVGRS